MVTVLSPPLALNGETLRQRIDERVDHTLGEASEEVQACGGKRSESFDFTCHSVKPRLDFM